MKRYIVFPLFMLLAACQPTLETVAVTRPAATPTAINVTETDTASNESIATENEVAIYLINADGTGLQQITEPASNNFLYDWSRDGQQLAFQGTPNGLPEIFLMDVASGQVQQLTELGGVTTAPSWSPDGRSLAFISRSTDDYLDQGLYLMTSEGGEARRLTEGLQLSGHPAQWSPDGRFLLFTGSRDETYDERRTDIYIVAADGTGLQALTDTPGEESAAFWSPDGQRIAFGYSDELDQWRVQVMNRDGSGLVELAIMPGWGGFAGWSPDGRSLLFATNFVPGHHPDAYDVYTIDIASGTVHNLTDNPATDYYPMWSPDGQRIVFISNRDGNEEIYVMAADGSRPTRLTFDNDRDWPALWSPNSQQIAFNRSPSLIYGDDDIQIDITGTQEPVVATTVPFLTPTTPPTPAPLSTTPSDDVEGWLLYQNSFYDYRFSYPPTATISVEGVNGFPTDELPASMTFETYMQQLENTFPNNICVSVGYETGFITFFAPWEEGGKYSGPCPGMGIGAYDLITATQNLTIDSDHYIAHGYVVREQNEAATWQGEFYSLQLHDGTSITYGSFQGAQEQYASIEGTLRRIVESYHAEPIEGASTAVYPTISLTATTPFTNTAQGYALHYPDGLYLLNDAIESDTYFATQPDLGSPLDSGISDFWITIRQDDNPDEVSLNQWAAQRIQLSETQTLIVADEPALQMSGNLAAAGDTHNGYAIITYFAHDGHIFTVTGLAQTAAALKYYTPVYQLLLDTFRFWP